MDVFWGDGGGELKEFFPSRLDSTEQGLQTNTTKMFDLNVS